MHQGGPRIPACLCQSHLHHRDWHRLLEILLPAFAIELHEVRCSDAKHCSFSMSRGTVISQSTEWYGVHNLFRQVSYLRETYNVLKSLSSSALDQSVRPSAGR